MRTIFFIKSPISDIDAFRGSHSGKGNQDKFPYLPDRNILISKFNSNCYNWKLQKLVFLEFFENFEIPKNLKLIIRLLSMVILPKDLGFQYFYERVQKLQIHRKIFAYLKNWQNSAYSMRLEGRGYLYWI